jgi:hypothetical protein
MLNPEYIGNKLRKMVDDDGCDPVKFLESVCHSYNKGNEQLMKIVPLNTNQPLSCDKSKFYTIPCKYFEFGSCRKGDTCTFKHEKEITYDNPDLLSALSSKRHRTVNPGKVTNLVFSCINTSPIVKSTKSDSVVVKPKNNTLAVQPKYEPIIFAKPKSESHVVVHPPKSESHVVVQPPKSESPVVVQPPKSEPTVIIESPKSESSVVVQPPKSEPTVIIESPKSEPPIVVQPPKSEPTVIVESPKSDAQITQPLKRPFREFLNEFIAKKKSKNTLN